MVGGLTDRNGGNADRGRCEPGAQRHGDCGPERADATEPGVGTGDGDGRHQFCIRSADRQRGGGELRPTGVTVDLGGGSASAVGEGTDSLKSISNVRGSELGDTITGSNQANLIDGLGGPDRLLARNGDDTVNGGAGDDELRGGRGYNILTGGEGIDDCSNAPGQGEIYECEATTLLALSASAVKPTQDVSTRVLPLMTSDQAVTTTSSLPAATRSLRLNLTWREPSARFSAVLELRDRSARAGGYVRVPLQVRRGATFLSVTASTPAHLRRSTSSLELRITIRARDLARPTRVTARISRPQAARAVTSG